MSVPIRMTETDLATMGLTVEGDQVVRADLDKKPDPSWTVEQLAIYAKSKMASSAQAEKEAILQAHKSAVDLFWAGAALWLIRDRLKKEERWVAWQKANKLARSTVLEAIALYENAKSPDTLVGLGITVAKERFGVVKPKPAPSTSTPTKNPTGKQGAGRQASPAPGPSGSQPAVPPPAPQPEPAEPVDAEERLRNKIQPVAEQLENWTLNDLGRLVIPSEQRTTWKNIAASLRATAKRIEDYLSKPVAKKSAKKEAERAA
jgi:hypothetical protein